MIETRPNLRVTTPSLTDQKSGSGQFGERCREGLVQYFAHFVFVVDRQFVRQHTQSAIPGSLHQVVDQLGSISSGTFLASDLCSRHGAGIDLALDLTK